jgi:O-antigen/teichoic acid export membrane protein
MACSLPQYFDMLRLFRMEKFVLVSPSMRLGFGNLVRSLALSGKFLLENARHQGVRIILAPLVGVTGIAAFSTMRTGANVALQGLNTVIHPLMPELMRFLHQRDQERSEAAFGTIWIVVVAIMAPAVVVAQVIMEPLYHIWTRGHVQFDPLLFGILSLTVLVYAVVQPAMAVVIGNNMLKPQIVLSALAAIVVIGVMYLLVPRFGIIGAGVALLAAEVTATMSYMFFAQRWLRKNGLTWPQRPFIIAGTSVCLAALTVGAMFLFPAAKWITLSVSLLLFLLNTWRYWNVLPDFATKQAKNQFINLPGIKKLMLLTRA